MTAGIWPLPHVCVTQGVARPVLPTRRGWGWARGDEPLPREIIPKERWRHSLAAGHSCGVDLVCAGDAAHTAEGHQRPGAGKKPRGLSRQTDLMTPEQPRPKNNAAQPLITRRAQTKQLAQAGGGRIFSGWEDSISPPSFCAAGRTEPAPGPRTGISTA